MQEGKIYKIVCLKTGLTYFGSTTCKTLNERIKNTNSSIRRMFQENIITLHRVR